MGVDFTNATPTDSAFLLRIYVPQYNTLTTVMNYRKNVHGSII